MRGGSVINSALATRSIVRSGYIHGTRIGVEAGQAAVQALEHKLLYDHRSRD